MKFSFAKFFLKFDLRSTVKASEVIEVNDLIVCLELPTNSFRTKIDTGKMFTPLCFFCKFTTNYVYIDLKGSL